MLDSRGYRLNVGIMLANDKKELFWAKRVGKADNWQFPQGGLDNYETAEEAMYRELHEEIGLKPKDVKIVSVSRKWLCYDLPRGLRRKSRGQVCVGQKQRWFLLRLVGDEKDISFNNGEKPEFDNWRWVDYWYPVEHIIQFKQRVYRMALEEFAGRMGIG